MEPETSGHKPPRTRNRELLPLPFGPKGDVNYYQKI